MAYYLYGRLLVSMHLTSLLSLFMLCTVYYDKSLLSRGARLTAKEL